MADWKFSGDDDTESKMHNNISYARIKLRIWARTAAFLLVLVGVYHFMGAAYFGLPAFEPYAQLVPEIVAKADGGAVFDAGHLITIAVGSALVWWL